MRSRCSFTTVSLEPNLVCPSGPLNPKPRCNVERFLVVGEGGIGATLKRPWRV